MSKEGQLWDDSALLNAFDQAISKYKKMHGKGFNDSSPDVTNDVSSINYGDASTDFDTDTQKNNDSIPETVHDGINNGSQLTVEVEEGSVGSAKEKKITNPQVPDEHAEGSNSVPHHDQSQSYSSSMDVDEYNQLYKQYYELEEQRQNIIQKMQQLSGDHYPYSGEASGLDWVANSGTQQYQSTSPLPCGTMVVTCCQSADQCSIASCCPVTCPFTGAAVGTCNGSTAATEGIGQMPAFENIDVVKTAMGAAERALSSFKEGTSDSKEKNKFQNVSGESANPETDFSTVLNAWYSAGFYTGKFLTERSLGKKQHD